MMLDGSKRLLAAMLLLLVMGQGSARSPSPEAASQTPVTRSAAPMTSIGSTRSGLANPPPAGSTSIPTVAAAATGGSAAKDCDALSLVEKEACYAGYDESELAECERVRHHGCAPYARVHRAELELEQIGEALLQEVRDTYASYEGNQPGYVKDVESVYAATDSAWRAYRDAHCALEPVVQGMSRQEAPGLTETCRAGMTEVRVEELKEQKSALFPKGTGSDERK